MPFAGDKKAGRSVLHGPEQRLKTWLLPLVPSWLETHHLTLTTVAWSLLILLFSFLARHDIRWLWLVSLMIVFQYVTDLLDGAVGRARDTGLVKWGYYMDHLLDYLFLCSILIGYAILLPQHFKYALFFILALFGGFMANSFLSFAATNEFQISYLGIGPTEVRIVFILVNTLLIVFGRTYMVKALPYVLGCSAFGLFVTVYRTQADLWKIDMRAKGLPEAAAAPAAAGDQPDEPGTDARPLPRVVWKILLTYGLMLAAFVLLMMRVRYPHHRKLALVVYLLSWIPFVLWLRARRPVLRRRRHTMRKKLRPYLPHVSMAVILLLLAYCAHVLAPLEPSPLTAMTAGELRKAIREDLQGLAILQGRMDSLVSWARADKLLQADVGEMSPQEKDAARDLWEEFTTTCLELDILQTRYKGFYQIDFLSKQDVHVAAFVIAYSAFITQLRFSLDVVALAGSNFFMQTLLNDADGNRHIPADTFSAVKQRCAHPDTLLRLNAGAAYLRIISKDLGAYEDAGLRLRTDAAQVFKKLGKNPEVLLKAPIERFEETAATAWLPFQKNVAIHMSRIRTVRRGYFISADVISEHEGLLQPGDILVERRNWHMTNVGIPGFWPHAAMYVGTPEQLNDHFRGLASLSNATPWSVISRGGTPAVRELGAPDEHGYRKRVIEALRDGVVLTSLERSANADYLGVMRPVLSAQQRFDALLAALSHYGKPYDYSFDFATDTALVCSELVYKAYRAAGGGGLEPTVMNGRLILPPNLMVRAFDDGYDRSPRPFEFVLFLDGSEEDQRVQVRGVDDFRNSWRRPKWDVMME